jgi:hypothetical protein
MVEQVEVFYKKPYKMRAIGDKRLNTVVSIPPEVIRRESEKRGISVPEFLEKYIAIAQYNNIDGVFYTFKEKDSENKKLD